MAWASYVLLNAGLLLRVVGEPLTSVRPERGIGWLLAVSALFQWLAAVLYALHAWKRVVSREGA